MADARKVDAKEASVRPELTQSSSLEVAEMVHEHADEALGFVEKHEGFILTPEEDKAVLRKIDRRILPLVSGRDDECRALLTTADVCFLCHAVHR